ncbi:MAG: Xaa-Pro peptidase family protein [Thermoanaerobaculia bacterium]
MLNDLNELMRERALDTVIVPMHEAMHPSFRWLSRGAKLTKGYAVKLLDRDPILVTYPMERDEAAASGLPVRLVHEFDHETIFRELSEPAEAYAELFSRMLQALGSGKSVGFFGNAPVQLYIPIGPALARRGWNVAGSGDDLLQLARKRKDAWEIDAIRSVGERTEQVIEGVRRILRDAEEDWDGFEYEGEPLTLGTLKRFVSAEIARLGMIEDHETILSQGRDAGVPHSRGDASAPVRPSVPIVLDIFPLDKVTGYFFDTTRTLCVGPIPDELRKIHAEVFEAFSLARDAMRPGNPASTYQAMVCDFFETRGYETIRRNPETTSGYVHGLGHGVGLDIHEKPSFSLLPSNRDLIEVGDIVTIEPGLYFPDREIGVRIEDTFVVTADGVESLCRGSYALEP